MILCVVLGLVGLYSYEYVSFDVNYDLMSLLQNRNGQIMWNRIIKTKSNKQHQTCPTEGWG